MGGSLDYPSGPWRGFALMKALGGGSVEKCVAPGCPGSRPGSEVLGMRGWSRAGVALVGAVGAAVFALPAPAGAAGLVVKVSPDQGLEPGQTVTVSGHGLPKSPKG